MPANADMHDAMVVIARQAHRLSYASRAAAILHKHGRLSPLSLAWMW
jgi:hypothetical protein